MRYDFDQVINRKNTDSIKWDHMTVLSDKVTDKTLPLWVADMDFPCPQPIIDALHKRVDQQNFGYSTFKTKSYYKAVKGWLKRRFDWEVLASEIFLTAGVVPAIDKLIQVYTKEGDGIIIQEPVYYPFLLKRSTKTSEKWSITK